MVLFCVNTFIGVASLATILVLDILGRTKTAEDAREILHYLLLVFPQYALGDALVQISRNDITAQLLEKFHMDTYQSPLGWQLLGLHYVFLAAIGAVLFAANLAIECRLVPSFSRQRCPYEASHEEDDDVSKERMRVEGGMSDDALQTVKLRKEYSSVYGTNVAVQNLSIGVEAGKCFGLLGTNGAGKSTTFRMLTTEIIPTAGRIIVRGKEIGSGPLCNGEVGYCPQSDGIDGFLSPHQCLTIHGEVCGLSNVPKVTLDLCSNFRYPPPLSFLPHFSSRPLKQLPLLPFPRASRVDCVFNYFSSRVSFFFFPRKRRQIYRVLSSFFFPPSPFTCLFCFLIFIKTNNYTTSSSNSSFVIYIYVYIS